MSASMCVCFAMARVCAMNFSISADAPASASASAVPRATSSASRASSALLASRRSRWPRASCSRRRLDGAGREHLGDVQDARGVVGRGAHGERLLAGALREVAGGTGHLLGGGVHLLGRGRDLLRHRGGVGRGALDGAGQLAQPRHHLAHGGEQRPALSREQGRRHLGHLEVALRHPARHLLGGAQRHHELALQPRHDRQFRLRADPGEEQRAHQHAPQVGRIACRHEVPQQHGHHRRQCGDGDDADGVQRAGGGPEGGAHPARVGGMGRRYGTPGGDSTGDARLPRAIP
ncbi:MAG: hypothetical protein MUC69_11850 [Gemmatimonadales bacterium]|nr:hypothetical protein [Gemmatimonadales bacterium]